MVNAETWGKYINCDITSRKHGVVTLRGLLQSKDGVSLQVEKGGDRFMVPSHMCKSLNWKGEADEETN